MRYRRPSSLIGAVALGALAVILAVILASGPAVAAVPAVAVPAVPGVAVSLSSDPASGVVVTATQTVTYTITFDNSAGIADATVNEVDYLSGVLGDAEIVTPPAEVAPVSGLTIGDLSDASFPISGTVAAGRTARVRFTVQALGASAGDAIITNSVAPAGEPQPVCTPPGPAAPPAECAVNPIRSYTIALHADFSFDTPPIHPGQVVHYRITITNSGAIPYTAADPVVIRSLLLGVLDDATIDSASITGGARIVSSACCYSGPAPTMIWSGALAPGAVHVITYRLVVNNPVGDAALYTHILAPFGGSGVCIADPGSNEAPCTSTILIKSYTVSIAATPARAASGQTVTYRVTVHSRSQRPYSSGAPAVVTLDLSGVLDRARFVTGSTTGGGVVDTGARTLRWAGSLAVGQTRVITFRVVVDPSAGGTVLRITARTPSGSGGGCPAAAPVAGCASAVAVTALLPETGDPLVPQAGGAGLLIIAGAALLFAGRRRRVT